MATSESMPWSSLMESLIKLTKLADPRDIYAAIHKLYANSHHYHQQWSDLPIDSQLINQLVLLVRRYDGNFQLKGLGIWLLDTIDSHCTHGESSEHISSPLVIEDLIRIAMEFSASERCLRMISRLVGQNRSRQSEIFEIGKR